MQILHDVSLKGYTSLHAGGLAKKLILLEENDLLETVITKAVQEGQIWLLGYGSNCLISDKGLPGTVIINQVGKIEQLSETRLRAGSGVNWDALVLYAVEHGLYGIEFTSGIPGGVGAAVAGNIAAYGHKVKDSFAEARLLNPNTRTIETWSNEQLEFDYRSSALQLPENKHLIVLDATFELSKHPTGQLEYESALKTAEDLGIEPITLADRRKIIMETRRRAGSLLQDNATGPWTAGSFFKNPVVDEQQIETIISHEETPITKDHLLRQNQLHGGNHARVSAAHVLLAAGFERGQSWGGVRLHPDHILKIENTSNATAQEIYEVVQIILRTVHEKLGITLEPEVRMLGEF